MLPKPRIWGAGTLQTNCTHIELRQERRQQAIHKMPLIAQIHFQLNSSLHCFVAAERQQLGHSCHEAADVMCRGFRRPGTRAQRSLQFFSLCTPFLCSFSISKGSSREVRKLACARSRCTLTTAVRGHIHFGESHLKIRCITPARRALNSIGHSCAASAESPTDIHRVIRTSSSATTAQKSLTPKVAVLLTSTVRSAPVRPEDLLSHIIQPSGGWANDPQLAPSQHTAVQQTLSASLQPSLRFSSERTPLGRCNSSETPQHS